MARLRIFAGPNGSGKSSLFDKLTQQYRFNIGIYLNPDQLLEKIRKDSCLDISCYGLTATGRQWEFFFKRHGLRKRVIQKHPVFEIDKIQFNGTPDAYLISMLADFLRHRAVALGKTVSFETVFSHPEKLDFMKLAAASDYRIYIYYVCLSDPLLNVERVALRVSLGGHDVSEEKIRERYDRSLNNLLPAMRLAYRTYIFDNSGRESRLIASVTPRASLQMETTQVPIWFDQYVLSRLDAVKE